MCIRDRGEVNQPEIRCPEFYTLCDGDILMASGECITFVANPKNNGSLAYGVTFRMPDQWVIKNGLDYQHTNSVCTFLSDMFAHGMGFKNNYSAQPLFLLDWRRENCHWKNVGKMIVHCL